MGIDTIPARVEPFFEFEFMSYTISNADSSVASLLWLYEETSCTLLQRINKALEFEYSTPDGAAFS